MLKWILAAIAAGLIAGFALWQHNLVKTSYVNGLPAYEGMPGRQYIFERDCYIFKWQHKRTDYPLVADHRAVPALPAQVSEKFVGANLPEVRILALVHVGDRVRIASVRRDQDKDGTHITYELMFLVDNQRPYPRLDANCIMDHSPELEGKAPQLLPIYLTEAVMH